MITANLASYPPRRSHLPQVVTALAPQVDRINLVLNEYDGPLEELSGYANVHQIMPEEDTKDAGKFYPDTSGADYVFFVDDDLIYPADFIAKSIERFEALGKGRFLGGYHASVYTKPQPSLSPKRLLKWLTYSREKIADHRKPYRFYETLEQPVVVDQVATNAAVMRGADVPPYAYMASSQKFVDVRLAKWCFENGIRSIALPKQADWLGEVRFDETIFHGFTRKNLPHVADEIWSYAFKAEGLDAPLRPQV